MLGYRFAEGKNSLNAIRLILAAVVIVSHSWWLGGYGDEPHPGGVKLGSWAVIGFFGISGYLITRSRVQARSAARYCRARFLRIYPGLLVCVAAVAFVIAPVTAGLTGRRYTLPDAFQFFVTNGLSAGMRGVAVPGIPGTLDGLPDPGSWDGPLWTLSWEIFCYIIVGVVLGTLRPKLARFALLVPFLLGSAFVFTLDAGWGLVPTPSDWPLVPVLTFLAGSLVYPFREHIPAHPAVVATSGTLVAAISWLGFAPSLVHVPMCIFLLAGSLHLRLDAVGSRYDISYGVYIYGWPIQQVLASIGIHTVVPPLVFAGISLIMVLPFAWLSCRYVEGPSRRWRRAKETPRVIPELA